MLAKEKSALVAHCVTSFDVEPNRARATAMGPMVVPKELMPPARLSLWAAVSGLPRVVVNGWAAVCWSENPKATINNEPRINSNEPILNDGNITMAPKAEIISPYIMLFLYPHLLIISVFTSPDRMNNINAPR